MEDLVYVFITSRIDVFNSLFYGTSAESLAIVHSVLSATTKANAGASKISNRGKNFIQSKLVSYQVQKFI